VVEPFCQNKINNVFVVVVVPLSKYVNVNYARKCFWQNRPSNAFVAVSVPVLPVEEKE
jgi:hypothetical protein